jgi:hypothetical protein
MECRDLIRAPFTDWTVQMVLCGRVPKLTLEWPSLERRENMPGPTPRATHKVVNHRLPIDPNSCAMPSLHDHIWDICGTRVPSLTSYIVKIFRNIFPPLKRHI